MMNMGILLRCYRPPLANVWWGGIRGHARAAGLSALLAATSAGLSAVMSNVHGFTAAVRRTVTSLLIGSSNRNLQGWSSNKIRALHVRYTI